MKNFGEFFNNQVENAGTIVLSRTDVTAPGKVQKAVEMLRERNCGATIVTTPIDQLAGEQLLELIEKPDRMMEELLAQAKEEYEHHHHHHHHEREACGCGESGHEHHHDHEEPCHERHHDHEEPGHEHHHDHGPDCDCGCHDHHHHHADEVFTSWGMETTASCSRKVLEEILEELAYGNQYGDVLRAKGMLSGENPGEWYYFDLVPEEFEIRTGAPDYTGRVCVIGANINEEKLNQAFGNQ